MSERITLDAGVAEELCEVLELCCSWFDAAPEVLGTSLWRSTAFDLAGVRADMVRLRARLERARWR